MIQQVPELLGTTPQSIDQAYKLNGYTSNNANNSQAIAAFLKQYFSPKDLAAFQKKFSLPSRPITKVVGPNEENNPGDEANLDVQVGSVWILRAARRHSRLTLVRLFRFPSTLPPPVAISPLGSSPLARPLTKAKYGRRRREIWLSNSFLDSFLPTFSSNLSRPFFVFFNSIGRLSVLDHHAGG